MKDIGENMEFISITLEIFGPRKGLLPAALLAAIQLAISKVLFRFEEISGSCRNIKPDKAIEKCIYGTRLLFGIIFSLATYFEDYSRTLINFKSLFPSSSTKTLLLLLFYVALVNGCPTGLSGRTKLEFVANPTYS